MAGPIRISIIANALQAQKTLKSLSKSVDSLGSTWAKTSDRFIIGAGIATAVPALHAVAAATVTASGALLALPAAGAVGGAAVATLAVGLHGVSDAFGALGEDQEKFNESIKGLAPLAKKFLVTLRGMRGEFQGLKNTVQGNLFAGFAGETEKLATIYLPLLRRGMGRVATSINGMAKATARAVSTPFFQGVVANTFRTSAKVVDSFTGAMGPLVKMLGALIQAGLPVVGRLSAMAAEWIKVTAASRSAGEWVTYFRDKIIEGGEKLKQFGRILLNVKDAISNLFSGTGWNPDAMLAKIESISQAFLKWSENEQNVKNLQEILTTLESVLEKTAVVVGKVFDAVGKMATAFNNLPASVQNVIVWIVAIGFVFGRLLMIFAPLITFIGKIAGLFGKLGGAFSKISGPASKTLGILGRVGGFLLRFAGPIGVAISAILLLVSAFRNWDKIKAIVSRVWTFVTTRTRQAWSVVKLVVTAAWAKIKNAISNGVNRAKTAVANGWARIQAATSNAWNRVKTAVVNAWNRIKTTVVNGVNRARTAVANGWNRVQSATSSAWNRIKTAVSNAWNNIRNSATNGVNRARTATVSGWARVRSNTTTAWSVIKTVVSNAWNNIRIAVANGVSRAKSAVSNGWNSIKSSTVSTWNGIKSAITNAINGFMTVVSGIKGRVIGAFSGAGSWLSSAGSQIISGLIGGIQSMASSAVSAATSVVSSAVSAARNALGIRSPSRVFRKIGQQTMQGFVIGVQDGSAGVKRELGNLTKLINKALDARYSGKQLKNRTRAVLRGLSDEYRAMTRNAKAQDRIAKRLDDAVKKAQELAKAAKEYSAELASSLIASGDVTALGRNEEDGSVSITGLLDELKNKVISAERYTDLIQKLSGQGLNKTTLSQLLSAGVEGGLATAEALAFGGKTAIAEVNKLTGALTSSGSTLGSAMADKFHGAGIQAANGLVRGLTAKGRALDRAAVQLARRIERTVKRALGIRSPSKVFKDIGDNVTKGLVLGLDETYVKRAGTQLSRSLQDGFSSTPALDAYVAGGQSSLNSHVKITLTAQEVSQLQRGRELQSDLDAYRAAGGRSRA